VWNFRPYKSGLDPMNSFNRLLAKSSGSPENPLERETLPGHIFDVLTTANTVVEIVGPASLRSFGLLNSFDTDLLRATVVRAAVLHDLGKANHQFQRMIRNGPVPSQALRHEWISVGLLLKYPQLDQWLFNKCSVLVRQSAAFAALGHHLKVEDASAISDRGGSGDTKVIIYCDHPDFRSCFSIAQSNLRLEEPPALCPSEVDLLDRPLGDLRKWLGEEYGSFLEMSSETKRFVALVKALVIAADVAGSVVPRYHNEPANWAEKVLSRICMPEELRSISTAALGDNYTRPFQKRVADSTASVTSSKPDAGAARPSRHISGLRAGPKDANYFSAIQLPEPPLKATAITSSQRNGDWFRTAPQP